VRPIRISVPLAARLRLPAARVSRALERVPLLRLLGDLVLGRAAKSALRQARAPLAVARAA
jgi:hypothetical protein